MDASTAAALDHWWAGLFGLDPAAVWSGVTVSAHVRLAGYPGWYVAWRDAGVHVSTPGEAAATAVASLSSASPGELQDVAFWDAFAHQRGLERVGPSTHAYLDRDLGDAPGVVELAAADLRPLRAVVDPDDWAEAALDEEIGACFGWWEDRELVAASALTDWDGTPRDVGVLVAPGARGRGLAEVVGRQAASWAVRRHGLARWTARTTNIASVRTAERLGFTSYATQLALRPPGS